MPRVEFWKGCVFEVPACIYTHNFFNASEFGDIESRPPRNKRRNGAPFVCRGRGAGAGIAPCLTALRSHDIGSRNSEGCDKTTLLDSHIFASVGMT